MRLELERSGPTPIYKQVENWLREQILSGEWQPDERIRSEIDLAADLQINRGTIRKAIETLTNEGLLVRIHGRGTFVSGKTLAQPLADTLTTFSEDLIDKRIPFVTRVLEQKLRPASTDLATRLGVAHGTPIFSLRRVRDVEDAPFVLLENYVVHERCPGIENIDFTEHRLFEILERHFNLKLAWGRRDFEAHTAAEEVAELLSIAPGAPVMFLRQTVYLSDNTPIEYSNLWLRGDQFRLSALVRRTGTAQLFGDVDATTDTT